MNKVLVVTCCLLGLAVGSVPAYAGSTKITLDCSAVAPDVMTGNATVTLCDASAFPCTAQTVVCPAVACDSSEATANQSTTISCAAPFKVSAAGYSFAFADYDGTGAIIAANGGNGTLTLNNGKGGGFGIAIGSDAMTLSFK
jgi:hypothetical protein